MTTPSVKSKTAQLPEIFSHYRSDIDQALRLSLSSDGSAVYDMLRYNMGWVDTSGRPCEATEGKALRPTLCLFASEAAGGSVDQAVPAAVALEFIHNFSLIHDDIQDGDATRHHRPTVWAVWGVPKALVAGNILRVIADRSLTGLLERGVDPDRALAAGEALTAAYLKMIEGQYLDLDYEGRPDIGMYDYLDMISCKTGALITSSLKLGALIATRDQATIDAFVRCGESLGRVFQIRDDVLGVWGDEETTGKPVGADIRRKKNSFPIVYAMAAAGPGDEATLSRIYAQDRLHDNDVDTVLDIMDGLDTRGRADELTAEYSEMALTAMSQVKLEPDAGRRLRELVHFLRLRDH